MKISSNYYDYYSQMYQLKSLSNTQIDNADSNSSKNETKVISSTKIGSSASDRNVDIAELNYSGRMLANSLKMQSGDSSEMSQSMENIKTDMDSLKTTDIDSISADNAKEILTQLQTDMSSINSPDGKSSDISSIDIDSMSESDMKDILKKIQDQTNSMTAPPSSTEASKVLSKIKEDMESIKTADIDSMSADDVKKALTNLKNDMASIKNPYGGSSSSQKMDIDSMTESDMKDMLKKIQEHAKKMTTQKEGNESSDMSSKVKEDMDTIKAANIDSMSADDIKKTLTQLKTDLESIKSPNGQANNISNIDIDNMSESDIKDILKKIQEQANNMPMMGSFDPSQMPNGIEGNENDTSTINSGIDT